MTYCTACGKPRVPFTNPSVTLAGQPSTVGGLVASILGWLVLGGGLMLALAVALLLQAIFPGGFAGWGLGALIAIATITVGVLLLVGGKTLKRSGAHTARSVRDQAIFALAANRHGLLTAQDVAMALAVSAEEADALLTDITKTNEDVTLEVDDDGKLTYRFAKFLPPSKQRWPETERVRVEPASEGVEVPADEEAALQAKARTGR